MPEILGTGVLFRTALLELACREQRKWSLLLARHIRTPVTPGFKSQWVEKLSAAPTGQQERLLASWGRLKRGETGPQEML